MKKNIKKHEEKVGFTLRGLENTRIESLSDGIFAIAIGLLLMSSDPPSNFSELMEFTRDLLPFAGTIAILMWIWYQHYLFFIRFGLRDAGTTAINTMLMFLVLFYAYPLKFMFRLLINLYQALLTQDQAMLNHIFTDTIAPQDTPTLMVIYGLGASAIFFVFVWLNKRALNRAEILDLSELEIRLTKNSIIMNVTSGVIPFLSVLIALFRVGGKYTFMISGFVYILYTIAMPLASRYGRKKLAELKAD
ncbi:TMEM175 family protein [Reichenbachiella ulvae]|uniref:TMEM175 family protein n=1 Tax=Reichenbachiella ulvae TaxID=2980104 RepID=A0ABT3CTX2_9BACT|nr:TMEM175 family protein [Reichenbachiella ulvae]MCV9387155.1 TMEM175 family protein [Reichenbachiella ulvae]